jgi:transcriptional regulator with XRE-family HTH domain
MVSSLHPPVLTLAAIMSATGLSQNKTANLLEIPASRLRAWLSGRSRTVAADGVDKIAGLHAAFEDADVFLLSQQAGWADVICRADAAMYLGIGAYALDWKMEAAKIPYLDFGALGQWLWQEDLRRWKK